ncbi:Beta-glucosidase 6 [Triticum urartu]|uniref:Beta-glucosidase 6 n=1 Tax=Triticum urartu TaxID=4572 RepID=M8A1T1_TRIUA|nr:Beta-glucosidase 6 [Triticum urartu]
MGIKRPGQCGAAASLALLLVLLVAAPPRGCVGAEGSGGGGALTRGSFPKGFVFGTASAAYQSTSVIRSKSICPVIARRKKTMPLRYIIGLATMQQKRPIVPIKEQGQYEGAVKADGRGQTIWDTFAHTFGKISDFSNADVAVDQYHRFEEDIQLMADMGMDAYRFSIAWARILPNGVGQVNQAGIDHYNKLINALLAKGIQPYVTLYHWDLPQALEDKYNGWLDRQIVDDFAEYAETCFAAFGDRVKHWITVNEPHTVAIQGYDAGLQAPGRCSVLLHLYCKSGNSGTEPYIVAHNFILAHAAVSRVYRTKYRAAQDGQLGMAFDVMWTKYRAAQDGQLGMAFDVMWYEPMSSAAIDVEATKRAQEFQLGWFADPFFFGDYPATMRKRVGERLAPANSIWLYIVPRGMRSLMNYVKNRYNSPPIYITENGMDDSNSPFIALKDALKDTKRIKYHNDYLTNLAASIKEDGCDVRGYFAWSLLDNWEWAAGYSSRFGLYFVDYNDKLKRYPKSSVQWFKSLLHSS